MSFRKFIVAIDGPAASGKSTVSDILAARLGFSHINSGAIYRCATLLAVRNKILSFESKESIKALNALLKGSTITMSPTGISLEPGENVGKPSTNIFLNGENVTSTLSSLEISNYVRTLAKIPKIRATTVEKQREMIESRDLPESRGSSAVDGVIVEGRDIGSVVYPNADVKIFLEAEAKARAKRRFNELIAKGLNIDKNGDPVELANIIAEITQRDHEDLTRVHSPLVKAKDAVVIDSSYLTLEQVVDAIEKTISQKLKQLK